MTFGSIGLPPRFLRKIEIEVNAAAQTTLKFSDGGLCVGAAKTLGAATFSSGLVDDVRIYNQTVTPKELCECSKSRMVGRLRPC